MITAYDAYQLSLFAGERAKKIKDELAYINEHIVSAANKGIVRIHLYKEYVNGARFDWQPLPEVVDILRKKGYVYDSSHGSTTVSWKPKGE